MSEAATVARKFFLKSATDSPDDPLPPDAMEFEGRVVLYETSSAAKEQADKIAELWRGCAGHMVNFVDGIPVYQLGQLSSAAG